MIFTNHPKTLEDLKGLEIPAPKRGTGKHWSTIDHYELLSTFHERMSRIGIKPTKSVIALSDDNSDMVAAWAIGTTYAVLLNVHDGATPLRLYLGVVEREVGVITDLGWVRKHVSHEGENLGKSIADTVCLNRHRLSNLKGTLAARKLSPAQQTMFLFDCAKNKSKWNNNKILTNADVPELYTDGNVSHLELCRKYAELAASKRIPKAQAINEQRFYEHLREWINGRKSGSEKMDSPGTQAQPKN